MMNIKTTIATFIVLLLTSQSLWADVRASLSRQSVYEGDSVSLNIVSNESGKGADPDLSVLQQDFDIVGT
ncbi:MAG: protein BatD, partial [Gammaproteobacteria bacterium]